MSLEDFLRRPRLHADFRGGETAPRQAERRFKRLALLFGCRVGFKGLGCQGFTGFELYVLDFQDFRLFWVFRF